LDNVKDRSLVIQSIVVNDASKCFVIAEIGHNHQGNIDIAKRMIKAAVEAGASAVKLQKRDNRSLFTSSYYNRPYNSENSFGDSYGEHREFLEFDHDQYKELQNYSIELGTIFFATAFDFKSADFLQNLNIPAFKVASGDLKNLPLINYLADFGKPLIISTGGGYQEDINRVVESLEEKKTPYSILQCTAGYPPAWNELNLGVITTLRNKFPNPVIGFSSHDNGIAMSVAAYALGARIIEKHFTLNRTLKGTDHAFSLEPQGLGKLVRDLDRLHVALGDGVKSQYESESDPLQKMGKKIVAAKALFKGTVLGEGDFDFKSPGDGLPPWRIQEIIGKILTRNLDFEEAVIEDDFL